MRTIKQERVVSSNVHSYGYDPQLQIIQVWFKSGDVYEYYRRRLRVWLAFKIAHSKGGFVHEELTPGGNYRKVG